jgi:hypothetical protein
MVEGNKNDQLLIGRGAKGTVLVSRELAWSFAQEFVARGAQVVNVSHKGEIVWSNIPAHIGRAQSASPPLCFVVSGRCAATRRCTSRRK